MPGPPGADLVVIQPGFVLGLLEAFLYGGKAFSIMWRGDQWPPPVQAMSASLHLIDTRCHLEFCGRNDDVG
jgi:hypothetical protein